MSQRRRTNRRPPQQPGNGLIVSILLVCCLGPWSGVSSSFAQPSAVEITEPDPTVTASAPEGHLMVHWRPVLAFEGMTYELELVDGGAGGKVWSRRVGADEASFLSGLAPGGSRVRVRSWLDSEPGPWSEPLDIVVDYPSHAMVRTLMFLGSVLFLATVGLVLGGHWTYRSESSTASRREEA